MKRHHSSDVPSSDTSARGAQTPEDEKAAHIAAALAKLKDPPHPSALIGQVVKAGEEPVRQYVTSPTEVTPASPVYTDSLESQITGSIPVRSQEQELPQPAEPAKKSGPLDPKELLRFGELLKQKQPPPPEPTIKAEVFAPTNPDPEATIAFQIAEKKRLEEEAAAAIEAEKWHVNQAKIHEVKLDKQKMYKLVAFWLGAIPAAFIMYGLVRLIGGSHVRGLVGFLVMLPIYLLGMYGLFGWVPLMLEYLKTQKR